MRLASFFILCIGLAGTSMACGGEGRGGDDDSEGELRRRASGALELKEADDGKAFTVKKGKDVRLTLPANPSTGYSWQITSTNRTFGYPSPQEGTFEGQSDGPVGSGGKQVFVWKTNSPHLQVSDNVHTVKMAYKRSFDDMPADKTFSFSVKIVDESAKQGPMPQSNERVCPEASVINCMPGGPVKPSCEREFRDWASRNCDVSYLD